jgi:hypothetical protein
MPIRVLRLVRESVGLPRPWHEQSLVERDPVEPGVNNALATRTRITFRVRS